MAKTRRPNILIFMTDHQRADTVLPEHPAVTPNLTSFAAQGVTFTKTFCPSPHCCPSRATFFTGLYPSRHGVWNNIMNGQALSRGLAPRVRLWSEDLAEAGYRLAWSGKWHVSLEESPKNRCWQELFVSGNSIDDDRNYWDHYREVARKVGSASRGEGEILRPGYGTYKAYGTIAKTDAHDDRVVEEALKALPEMASGADPWAMFVGVAGPHDPYMVPQKYVDLYDLADVRLPESYHDDLADKPRIYRRIRDKAWGQMTEREVREAIRHFWAYCSYLDELFGKLLAGLEATGQAKNTLVLYCADHGDYCGEHGLFAKGILCFQGAYHVPAVVRWPAGIARAGRRVEELISLADFGPTFTELSGKKCDAGLTGRSLVPFFKDTRPEDWRDEIHTQCNGVELYYTQRSVMTRDFKYVFNGFDEDELYDLRNDPHEMRNLAQEAAFDAVKRDLVGRLWRFALKENDSVINSYITVSLAPWGPAEAFRTVKEGKEQHGV